MNKILKLALISLGISLLSFTLVNAQTISYPNRGGTGTTTIPSLGQVLVGQSNGTYGPQATSTLGISGGGGSGTVTSITASSPLTGGVITTSGSIGCQTASGSLTGCLSSTDWTTFNNKLTNLLGGLNALFTNATTTNLGISGLSNTLLAVNANGSVIATTTPSGTVTSVATDATLTGGTITTSGTLGINLATANAWTATASTTFVGSVGIGTTTPIGKLSIALGTNASFPAIFVGSTTASSTFFKVSGRAFVSGGNSQAFFSIATSSAVGSAIETITHGSFQKLTFPGATKVDNGGNWNSGSSWYVVPVSGTYEIAVSVRYVDGATTGVSYEAVANANADQDAPNGLWCITGTAGASSASRQGCAPSVWFTHFNAGNTIRLDTYWDNGSNSSVTGEYMAINLLSAD